MDTTCPTPDSLVMEREKENTIHSLLTESQATLDMLLHLFLITALHFINEETEAHRNKLKITQPVVGKARI